MDQATLYSPVDGWLNDLGGLIPGINITPANNTVHVMNSDMIKTVFIIPQSDLLLFKDTREVSLEFAGIPDKLIGTAKLVPFGKDGTFKVYAVLIATTGLLPSMKGEVSLVD